MATVAAENLGITAKKLSDLGVVDEIIEEPVGGAHADPSKIYKKMKTFLKKEIKRYSHYSTEKILDERYQKFRALGRFSS